VSGILPRSSGLEPTPPKQLRLRQPGASATKEEKDAILTKTPFYRQVIEEGVGV